MSLISNVVSTKLDPCPAEQITDHRTFWNNCVTTTYIVVYVCQYNLLKFWQTVLANVIFVANMSNSIIKVGTTLKKIC